MKKIFLMAAAASLVLTGCMQEFDPQTSYVSGDQASNAPGAYDNFVNAITSSLAGTFTYGGNDNLYAFDFGYPSFYLERDLMGQDMIIGDLGWFGAWYACDGLGNSAYSQLPLTYYPKWIKNCNTLLDMVGDEPDESKFTGAGIAHAMRAMFYMDLARMYAPKTYAADPEAPTYPKVTEKTTIEQAQNNPRLTNTEMWAFILEDLDKAEKYLADYVRPDKYTPDLSVVYGLKARAYLTMENWEEAEKYAKLAQQGYTMLTEAQYLDRDNGFNSPNASWMMGLTYRPTDPNIILNDGDSSWASFMCLEATASGMGYASDYGAPMSIDRHLYETIPATDFRKMCFIDFAIDEPFSGGDDAMNETLEALSAYSDYPESLYVTGSTVGYVGGLSVKFRLAGGAEGRSNQYVGFTVAVPMMRVEEMYLIEAEAAGMQEEGRGIELLTAFAKQRDPNYTYGKHNEAYGNTSTSAFQNECWWQRRVEFWGEGLATFDIKRLQKGIIRSYANTNHHETNRWNLDTTPVWMTLYFITTESAYNNALVNNELPIAPEGDSPEYVW